MTDQPKHKPNQTLIDVGLPQQVDAVAVIGAGQMGLVAAQLLSAQPFRPRITLLAHTAEEAGRLAQTRMSERLAGFRLDESVRVTHLPKVALAGAKLVAVCIPVQFIGRVMQALVPHLEPGAAVVSFAKGIETGTLRRPLEIIGDAISKASGRSDHPLGVLSGPTIAHELAQCLPATMIAASTHPGLAAALQAWFGASWLRIYTHHDVVGVEVAGATKNVIAIAAGILDGLKAGYNAKSTLLARGLAEITRLGIALGADRETFFGIAGVGDLATTCFSPEGRNRSCGEALGQGRELGEYLASSIMVVEGVETTRAVVKLAQRHDVDMPITQAVHAILFNGLDPLDAISTLMTRPVGVERIH